MDNEIVQKYLDELHELRESRLDSLNTSGSLNEIIADLMNALEVTFIILNSELRETQTQPAKFVPVSISRNDDSGHGP